MCFCLCDINVFEDFYINDEFVKVDYVDFVFDKFF